MAYLLTLAYIALALLSPKDFMPALAEYRVELLVAILALIASTPKILSGRLFRIPQTYLLFGLFAAVFLSIAIGDHWPGGGFVSVLKFTPTAIVLYLVVLNCRSIRKLQVIVFVIALIGILYVVQGARAYYAVDPNVGCLMVHNEKGPPADLPESKAYLKPCSPLLEAIPLGDGTWAFRMRGLGFFKDPNELAQFLVMIIPLLWISWRSGSYVRNILIVIVPTALLVWGMYLTHSRGGLIALVVILMLALRGRVSLVTAVLSGALLFGLMVALNFSGGRDISVQAGSNRFILWGDGLALFKSSPAFGVGYENFADANRGQTAHNSFIVCLAELGLFGYAFWVALLVFTISGLNSLIASLKQELSHSPPAEDGLHSALDVDAVELKKWAEGIRLSLAGFLVAAFFLSRAYALTLYLTLGMAVVIKLLSSEEEQLVDEPPLWRRFAQSAAVGCAMIVFIYVALRIGNAMALDKGGF